jgi:hypothetical protein
MVKRLSLLAGAVKVALPDRAFGGTAVRRNQEGHHMATFEAVAQALGVLEGEAIAGPLFDFYRRATDRMLLVRGKLRLGDVYGGVEGPSSEKEEVRKSSDGEAASAGTQSHRQGRAVLS